MGALDSLRNLFAPPDRTLRLPASARVVEAVPVEARGISGVSNFAGRIIREPIAELRDQAGFGRAGTYEWGFWRDLEASNSFVAQALDHVCSPVADARIDVVPPPAGLVAPDVAEAMTRLVEWNLTEKLRLGTHLTAAARGFLLYGFALFEPSYEMVTAGPHAGRWAVKELADRLPQSLHSSPWLEAKDGKTLEAVRQQGTRGGSGQWVSPVLPASEVLLYIWQREGNNWAGESAFRPVQYIAGKVMPTLLRLVGVALQREGAGIPTVEAMSEKAELTAEQRRELQEVLANLTFHENANLVLPAGWKMQWLFSPGANKGHIMEAWRQLGVTVLQMLGAQQLALGTSDTGSRSVGEVHDARSAVKVRAVLKHCESVLNGDDGEPFTGLVQRLCRFNFGPQAAYPRVTLTMQRPELSVRDMVESAVAAKGGGLLTVRLEDENAVREKLSLGPISVEEREAAKARATELAPPVPPAPGALPPGPVATSAQRAPWTPWRALRTSEEKVQWRALDDYLTAQREAFERKAQPTVLAALAMAAPALERAMADGTLTPAEVAAVPLDVRRLGAIVDDFLAQVRRTGQQHAKAELAGNAITTAAEEEEQDDRNRDVVREEADEVVDATGDALKRRIENRLRAEVEREAIDALRTGSNATEVLERVVARQLSTGAFRADAGTVVAKVLNVGRDEAARELGGVATVEYSAILDSATCGPCRAMDGRTAPFESAEHDRMLPPNRDCAGGDNCRCLLVFVPARGES